MEKAKIGLMELSRLAGVSYDRAYHWLRERKIPAVKDTRGRWVIDQAEVERFLKERRSRMPGKNEQAVEHLKNLNLDDILKFLKFFALIAIVFRFFGHENIGIEKWLDFMTLLISI